MECSIISLFYSFSIHGGLISLCTCRVLVLRIFLWLVFFRVQPDQLLLTKDLFLVDYYIERCILKWNFKMTTSTSVRPVYSRGYSVQWMLKAQIQISVQLWRSLRDPVQVNHNSPYRVVAGLWSAFLDRMANYKLWIICVSLPEWKMK